MMSVRNENLHDRHEMGENILPSMAKIIDNYCDKYYSCKSSFVTKNLQNHLKLKYPKYNNIVVVEDKRQKVWLMQK